MFVYISPFFIRKWKPCSTASERLGTEPKAAWTCEKNKNTTRGGSVSFYKRG